jgi:DHA2 family methylenomycin A resistance protein-like MFS transporter
MTTAVLASVDKQRAGTASAVLNTARQAGGAVGVAAFGALASAAGAAHVVAGLKSSTLISSGILLCALGLACLVHPEAHAHDASNRRTRDGRTRPASASE